MKNFTDALKYTKQLNTFFVNTIHNEGLKNMVNEHLEKKVCTEN